MSARVLMNPIMVRKWATLMVRTSTTFRSGAIKPKPVETPFGIVGIVCAVLPGLFIGATISKNVANFLEENDLFVPSEDEDDD